MAFNYKNLNFDTGRITPDAIQAEMERLTAAPELKPKGEILNLLINQFKPIDFVVKLYPDLSEEELREKKVKRNELKVLIIDEILQAAALNNWALCKQGGFCYLYNGQFWETLNEDDLKHFLSDCAAKLGTKEVIAKECNFVEELYKQLLFSAHLHPPEFSKDKVLINLQNGTFAVSTQKQVLKSFSQDDFLMHQLPFRYDEKATAP
ncbi:MAG: hypothetical protein LBT24_01875, partial [Tannerella sp.]|nr:hypothetical protein [Tannerella sp.]